ncbi:MAG: WYL domain-containing protein [Rhizobiaceae bacterium]|nr:WYL domain-containing protein [Rhizobiaceae bacterium]
MSTTPIILDAIEKRRVVSFRYKEATRTAEPYILGFDDKNTLVLSAVQLTGGSGTGFRTYRMDELSFLHMTDRTFSGRHPDYNPRDVYFVRVLGKV